MIRDYKHRAQSTRPAKSQPLVKWHWHGALFFVVAAVLAIGLVETEKSEASAAQPAEEVINLTKVDEDQPQQLEPEWEMERYEIALPPLESGSQHSSSVIQPSENDWQRFVVKPGYNLAIICSRAGVKPSELHKVMQLGKDVSVLNKLRPNDVIKMKILPDGRLAALEYEIHQSKRLHIARADNSTQDNPFSAEVINSPLEVREAYANGVIESSLIMAARKVQLDREVTYELMRLFGWDIDFSLDVRKGDRFTVVYEEYYRDGEKIKNTGKNRIPGLDKPIIAAEFINNGKVYRAIRYTDPKGHTAYYSPEGRSIRKAFLRNPVDARISSHFNPRRKHPILNKIRAHKGVDYGAPTGSPIKVVGDGKVIYRGRKGGYGKTLIIQHGQRYSTLYAHMSRYAKNTAKGRKVKQGQIIGYIGKSGLATGPHLHYEFRVDGIHRNPLTIKHPSVAPVPVKFRTDFLAKASAHVAQLDTLGRLQVAFGQSKISPNG